MRWREYKSYYALTGLVLVLFIISSWLYLRISENSKTQYLQQYNDSYANQIDITIDFYDAFSEFLFYHLIDETVLEIMYRAALGDQAEQAIAREDLQDYLQVDYDLVIDYDFRQMHFHLPDGKSFLRMHQPDTFGDNLFDARESIRLVNTEERIVKGFEEGRVYNGYRFVYPLNHQDVHIGSVEVSISISTLIDMLYKIQPERAHFFLIEREVVEELVFDEFFENYVQSVLSGRYMYDRVVNEQFSTRRKLFEDSEDLVTFFEHISNDVCPRMHEAGNFFHVVFYEGVRYTLQFVSIENIEGNHVGYVFTVFEDDAYQRMVFEDRINLGAIFLFYSVSYAGAFIFVKDKRRIIKLSQKDGLTALANRRAFNDIAKRAFERAKRSGEPLSLIVMDVDHFKAINDVFGHLEGDVVLKRIGEMLSRHVQPGDVLSRWGGEEFALLLNALDKSAAIKTAKAIQESMKELDVGLNKPITLSFGIATFKPDMKSIDDLFKKADNRLYQAKEAGRDTIIASN